MSEKLKEEGFVAAVHQQNSRKPSRSKVQVFLKKKSRVIVLFKRVCLLKKERQFV